MQPRHRLHRLRPSNVAAGAAASTSVSTWHGTAAAATFGTALAVAARIVLVRAPNAAPAAAITTNPALATLTAITTTFATAPAGSAITTAIPALATLAPAITAA